MGRWVGGDVGGSKVLAGVVSEDGEVVRTVLRVTPGRLVAAEAVEDAVVDAVTAAARREPVAAVGVAAAGFVDRDGSRVVFAPHLPWRGEDVRTRLGERLGVPVLLENDATAAAHAEATYGAGRGAESMVLVALGTGIGGGLVVGGRVWRGHHGMAGEFGHMQVVPDGAPCECGRRGCWEQYSSGNALVARAAFASVGRWLGVGLANLVAAFDPALLVVGGGVAVAGERLLGPARDALATSLVGAGHREVPPLVPAALGPAAGLVGAATLAGAGAR